MRSTGRRAINVEELFALGANVITTHCLALRLAFIPRASDIIICTYPKFGTTWMQQIVHGLRSGGAMDFAETRTCARIRAAR